MSTEAAGKGLDPLNQVRRRAMVFDYANNRAPHDYGIGKLANFGKMLRLGNTEADGQRQLRVPAQRFGQRTHRR
jgi:hypothetical protein